MKSRVWLCSAQLVLETWCYVNIIHKHSTQTNGRGTTLTLSLLRNNILTIPYNPCSNNSKTYNLKVNYNWCNIWIQLIGKCTIIPQGNKFDYKKSIKCIKRQMQLEWWEPLNWSHVDQNSCLLLYEWPLWGFATKPENIDRNGQEISYCEL
jgi:hypothetical protein